MGLGPWKDTVVPPDANNYLAAPTDLVTRAHALGLQVFFLPEQIIYFPLRLLICIPGSLCCQLLPLLACMSLILWRAVSRFGRCTPTHIAMRTSFCISTFIRILIRSTDSGFTMSALTACSPTSLELCTSINNGRLLFINAWLCRTFRLMTFMKASDMNPYKVDRLLLQSSIIQVYTSELGALYFYLLACETSRQALNCLNFWTVHIIPHTKFDEVFDELVGSIHCLFISHSEFMWSSSWGMQLVAAVHVHVCTQL